MSALRVLVATDGSAHADRAVRLAGSLALPEGSSVRIVMALPVPASLAAATYVDGGWQVPVELAAAAASLARDGVAVETVVLNGHPATAITDEAAGWAADLVVCGSRGRGGLATTLLGSVAAGVVDRAHCPVLVARTARLRSVVLGDDGSEGAAAARHLVRTWAPFAALPVRVVSVARAFVALATGIAPTMRAAAAAAYESEMEESRRLHRAIAGSAAEELGRTGRTVTVDVREGDPAEQIVAVAEESDADLVVVGSRGRTGIARALLGSVARHVLVDAPCSVLIVRPPAR